MSYAPFPNKQINIPYLLKIGNGKRRRGKTFEKITRIRARRTCRRKTSRERKTGTRTESQKIPHKQQF